MGREMVGDACDDVIRLERRVQRLEALLGTSEDNAHILQAQLGAARATLRQQVPDEAVAAHRALALLSRATTTTTGDARSAVSAASALVARAEGAVSVLREAEAGGAPVAPPSVSDDMWDQLHTLRAQAGKLARRVDAEDESVDRLLVAFDAATARINGALLAIAAHARRAGGAADAAGGGGVDDDDDDGGGGDNDGGCDGEDEDKGKDDATAVSVPVDASAEAA